MLLRPLDDKAPHINIVLRPDWLIRTYFTTMCFVFCNLLDMSNLAEERRDVIFLKANDDHLQEKLVNLIIVEHLTIHSVMRSTCSDKPRQSVPGFTLTLSGIC